jgi:hypothetical protein
MMNPEPDSIKYISKKQKVEVPVLHIKKTIVFTAPTAYEIYDKFGNIVGKSYAKEVNIASLDSDVYYLNYDNSTTEFIHYR